MNDYVPGSSPTPDRRRRRVWPYVAFAVFLLGGLAAILWPHMEGNKTTGSADAATVPSFTVNGTLSLGSGQFVADDNGGCVGAASYKDLAVGATVTVSDATGGVLGSSKISSVYLDGTGSAGACDLKFSVAHIPTGKGTYGITIANRGTTKYDEAKLRGGPLQMSVG
jgi:hypothetical protein